LALSIAEVFGFFDLPQPSNIINKTLFSFIIQRYDNGTFILNF